MGGVGSILLLLLAVPDFVGAVLVTVGWILILIAVKRISDIVGDKSIFKNAIIAVILSIVGVAVLAFLVLGSVFAFMGLNGLNFGSNANQFASAPPSSVFGLIAGVIAGLTFLWIASIVSAVFLKKSYDKIGDALNVKTFKTAAFYICLERRSR
jgi:uncharacterized membrane protein